MSKVWNVKKTTESTYAIQCTKELKNPNGKKRSCQQGENAKEDCVKIPTSLGTLDYTSSGKRKREFILKDAMEKLENIDLNYTINFEKNMEQVRINENFKMEIEHLKLN